MAHYSISFKIHMITIVKSQPWVFTNVSACRVVFLSFTNLLQRRHPVDWPVRLCVDRERQNDIVGVGATLMAHSVFESCSPRSLVVSPGVTAQLSL
mmetsp:Transcript_11902/g.35775  ORF Transcript_11902/g.35775 Transcript_11902/m.35775 type:complete len:96 (-) Transcript_11902:187-474(-)